MDLYLFTTDPEVANGALGAGISTAVVDWE